MRGTTGTIMIMNMLVILICMTWCTLYVQLEQDAPLHWGRGQGKKMISLTAHGIVNGTTDILMTLMMIVVLCTLAVTV